uniref:Hes family bHLH transcription factor 3 n=1 Tax=Neogobius melanostomus TaxID=47308 RepID=A0A8C6TJT6_9GOBI
MKHESFNKAVYYSLKVSKPLMEKKRRARINQCLDQLKSLLESHYSTTIHKRKLEKADILELTVRHLKHLQKIFLCCPESEYQPGFRSCLSHVNHYLLTADHVSGADRWTLSQLTSRLSARRPEEGCSTMDSAGHARSTGTGLSSSASGSEESNTASCKAYSSTAHGLTKAEGLNTAPPAHKNTQTATSLQSHCEVLNDQLDVWRPW